MRIKANQLVAHRGYQHRFPENSLLAIHAAIQAGAVNIEIDVQLNDQREVILFHDSEMERITGQQGCIHSMATAQLSDYYCSEPHRLGSAFSSNSITLLADLLPLIKRFPQVNFFIELKEESIARYGVDVCLASMQLVLQNDMSTIILISFSEPAVTMAKSFGFLQTALVIRDWGQRNLLTARTQADYIFVNHQRIGRTERIEANVPVILYEIGDVLLAENYLSRGAYAIETFLIGDMIKHSSLSSSI